MQAPHSTLPDALLLSIGSIVSLIADDSTGGGYVGASDEHAVVTRAHDADRRPPGDFDRCLFTLVKRRTYAVRARATHVDRADAAYGDECERWRLRRRTGRGGSRSHDCETGSCV